MALHMSTRRQALVAGVMTTLPLISGCAGLSSAEEGTGLGHITVENSDDAPHTIHVVVEQESDLIFGSSHELEAVSAPDDADDFGSIDSAVLGTDAWEGQNGSWTIYTRVDDQTTWDQHDIPSDDATSCHSVRLKIEDDSSVTSFTPDCESWPPSNAT